MRKRIILISHCFLNDAAKLKNQPVKEQAEERRKKRTLLGDLIKSGMEASGGDMRPRSSIILFTGRR